jgi:hypothetical protein
LGKEKKSGWFRKEVERIFLAKLARNGKEIKR